LDKTDAHDQFASIVFTYNDPLQPLKHAFSNPYQVTDGNEGVPLQFNLPADAEFYRIDLVVAHRG
jgi:hypothetical protein